MSQESFDGVADEVAKGLNRRFWGQDRVLPGAPLVEDLGGPSAQGLGRQGE
jgi:hypothetical protein